MALAYGGSTRPNPFLSGLTGAIGTANPILGAVGMGLGALGSFFGGRRESREREKDRELQRESLALQRQRFGQERQQYQDELARQRAQSAFTEGLRSQFTARGGLGNIGAFDPSARQRRSTEGTRQDLQSLLAGIRQRDMGQG